MRWIFILCSFCFVSLVHSQEIKSSIEVVAPGVQMTNKQILTTLQSAIEQFINNRKWTDDNFEAREKIEVSFFFNVTAFSQNNDFETKLQITSSRPVYNSTYKTQVISFIEDEVTFNYREFESLDYQEGQNMHELTTLLAFYVNIVLGYDYDSFGELGGTTFFTKAQSIVNLMSGKPGWGADAGQKNSNRYTLAENLNNVRFQVFRKLTYNYHRKGMDAFYDKPEDARAAITDALKTIQDLVASYGGRSLVQRTFFMTKKNELVDIYKGATVPEKNSILELLSELDPSNVNVYQKIKE